MTSPPERPGRATQMAANGNRSRPNGSHPPKISRISNSNHACLISTGSPIVRRGRDFVLGGGGGSPVFAWHRWRRCLPPTSRLLEVVGVENAGARGRKFQHAGVALGSRLDSAHNIQTTGTVFCVVWAKTGCIATACVHGRSKLHFAHGSVRMSGETLDSMRRSRTCSSWPAPTWI